jgi:hypothetical protein
MGQGIRVFGYVSSFLIHSPFILQCPILGHLEKQNFDIETS